MEHCTREKEIDELKAEVSRLRDLQFEDHHLLGRLDAKMDNMIVMYTQLVQKVDVLVSQPGNDMKNIRVAAIATIIGGAVMLLVTKVIGG